MLLEATDTAQLDMAVRPAIMQAIEDTLHLMGRGLSTTDLHSLALRIQHHPAVAVRDFIQRLGTYLTRVAQNELRARYGDYISGTMIGQHGWLGEFPVQDFSVRVEVDDTQGSHGRIDYSTRTLFIMLPSDHIVSGLVDSLSEHGAALPLTIHALVVHEFAHILQDIRKRARHFGMSYSTGGEARVRHFKDDGRLVRSGKRYTSPLPDNPNDLDLIRYLSTADEIDAYASQAAAELIRQIEIDNPHPKQVMEELLTTIRTGNPASAAVSVYLSMLRSTFAGHYPTLKKPEIAQVWKRFIRALWKKLHAYSRQSPGRSETSQVAMNPHWVEWARRLPRSAFMVWLAGQVSDDLLRNKPRSATKERIMDSIGDGTATSVQHDAERFIETYYYGYGTFNAACTRVIALFRRMVQRKVLRSMNREEVRA